MFKTGGVSISVSAMGKPTSTDEGSAVAGSTSPVTSNRFARVFCLKWSLATFVSGRSNTADEMATQTHIEFRGPLLRQLAPAN
jgi:hypothetical protein